MVSAVIKNWDKNNWLSSKNYILSFINFLLKSKKLDINSKILDIGCGRGKIIGVLSSKLKLKNKPIGIDLINHRDKDKRFYFKKIDALSFFSLNRIKFDLIIVKQTIHLLRMNEIKILLNEMKKSLSSTGKILILTLNPKMNEIPKFSLMNRKISKSFERDRKILKYIEKLYPKITLRHFTYKVKISKKKYIEMIKQRYISTLLGLTTKQILAGVKEINSKYNNMLKFNDKLVCIIIKNN